MTSNAVALPSRLTQREKRSLHLPLSSPAKTRTTFTADSLPNIRRFPLLYAEQLAQPRAAKRQSVQLRKMAKASTSNSTIAATGSTEKNQNGKRPAPAAKSSPPNQPPASESDKAGADSTEAGEGPASKRSKQGKKGAEKLPEQLIGDTVAKERGRKIWNDARAILTGDKRCKLCKGLGEEVECRVSQNSSSCAICNTKKGAKCEWDGERPSAIRGKPSKGKADKQGKEASTTEKNKHNSTQTTNSGVGCNPNGQPLLMANGENYIDWRKAWTEFSSEKGLTDVFATPEDQSAKKDEALALLVQAVEPALIQYVLSFGHPSKALSGLKEKFAWNEVRISNNSLRTVIGLEMAGDASFESHVKKFDQFWTSFSTGVKGSPPGIAAALRPTFDSAHIKGFFFLMTLPTSMDEAIDYLIQKDIITFDELRDGLVEHASSAPGSSG